MEYAVVAKHCVASDLGLQCLLMTLYRFPGKNGFMLISSNPLGFNLCTELCVSNVVPFYQTLLTPLHHNIPWKL